MIPAIQNGMIFFEADLDPDLIQRAGPRVIEGLHGLSMLYDQWREKVR
ncbi:MAG: hypothetical protein LRZ88_05470 [Candidatus Cloacimonetes bacterium]|nr:hypothetical protein [Candidatus Cloacimonadota bacterium]